MNAKSPNEEALLEQALTFASAEARLAYLHGACGGDEQLRARVEALIEAHECFPSNVWPLSSRIVVIQNEDQLPLKPMVAEPAYELMLPAQT